MIRISSAEGEAVTERSVFGIDNRTQGFVVDEQSYRGAVETVVFMATPAASGSTSNSALLLRDEASLQQSAIRTVKCY